MACNPKTAEARFWSKVDKNGPVPGARPELGPCWLWTAGRRHKGYGEFWVSGALVPAHRFAYELLVGPIPEGLELDHLCRVHPCVNAGHLEPVTHQENMQRGNSGRLERERTHCPQGHPYDAENTRWYAKDWRRCRACDCTQKRTYRAKRRAAAT